ncbi:hypothetical protein TanjilG_05417 [Lupinus angustifolius]|uniref:DUF632 domain-containing protein n=1 Tax=Lupinus angustifolius TaxID=3871 RepID=A0A1J7HQ47_LUPAN|nr:PREDICTED: uncharacterized protein PFB0145c-like [Lupinus angustifolius]OIW14796.1 hypothetical protein TanjilG_05417 [Lupinus angustifolius]
MGCNTSKLDRLPAVALCRDRRKFMKQALSQSYVFANAHVAHMESLNTLASSLSSFLNQFQHSLSINQIISHSSSFTSHSRDDDDAHVHLHSDSELEEEEEDNNNNNNNNNNRDKEFSSRHDVAFMNYVPFSPPLNHGGYYGSKSSPPPPPPSFSAWDYFNLFEPLHRSYETPYNPSHGSYCDEATEENDKRMVAIEEDQKVKEDDLNEKKLVSENEIPELEKCSRINSIEVESKKGLCETVKEIQILFEKASDSGKPILEMLEVGKLCYNSKFAFNQVSCKVKHVFTPSISSLVGRRMGIEYEVVDRDNGHSYGNLCFTLKKLCMWEKKLYHEVKAEEKLRILHQKKCSQLKRMNKKGADAQKVETVQTFIALLATKMKISVQVVDKISITISKLREEELWPQINKFIHMFLKMWEDMQECYRCQYKEIAELKAFDASTFDRNLSNDQIDAAIKLKSELQNWNLSLSDWIHAQISHVKALNGWLVRCLMYEPEEVPDDSTPFSPSKIGAPPVFVICNKWSRLVDNISEKNVMEAVNGFMLRINDLLDKHILDLQQKLTLDKELERKVKILERHEQKMHKVVQARERKMVPIVREESVALLQGDDAVHHGDFVDDNSMQSHLKQFFSAMEKFSASTAQLYKELCQQIKPQCHVLGDSNKIY